MPFSPLGAEIMPGNTCGEQQQRRHTAQMAVMGARAQWIRGTCRESGRAGRSAGARAGARVPVRRREPDADERRPCVSCTTTFTPPHPRLFSCLCPLTGTPPAMPASIPPHACPPPLPSCLLYSCVLPTFPCLSMHRAPRVSMPVDAHMHDVLLHAQDGRSPPLLPAGAGYTRRSPSGPSKSNWVDLLGLREPGFIISRGRANLMMMRLPLVGP